MSSQLKIDIDQPLFREAVRSLAYHEAGHYIIARLVGFKTGNISVVAQNIDGHIDGSSGVMLQKKIRNENDILKYLGDRVQVLLAGAFSETLSSNKVDEDATVKILEEGGAKQDLAKIIELLHLIRNIRYPDTKSDEEAQSTLDSIKDELWGKTKKLVERESESICGLGDRIASEIKKVGDRVILKADEINALLPIKTRFPL